MSTAQLERLVYCNCNLQLLEKNSSHPHPSQVNVDKIDIEKIKFVPDIPQQERDLYTLLYEELTLPAHSTRQTTHTLRGSRASRDGASTSTHADLAIMEDNEACSSSDPDSHESQEPVDDASMDEAEQSASDS